MRLKANMTVSLEKHINACMDTLNKYNAHLSCPLPHSAALQRTQAQWRDKEVCTSISYTCIQPNLLKGTL